MRANGKEGERQLAVILAGFLLGPVGIQFLPLAEADTPTYQNPQLNFGFEEPDYNRVDGTDLPGQMYSVVWATSGSVDSNGVYHQLGRIRDRGQVPVILWYYWGDEISVSCVQNGCWDGDNHKYASDWNSTRDALIADIRAQLSGHRAIVVVEPEFNKGGIDTTNFGYTFDFYLRDHVVKFNQISEVDIETVVGFGIWRHENWPKFTNAVAASTLLGTQLLWVPSAHTITNAAERIDERLAYLVSQFGPGTTANRPARTIIYDFGISTWGSSGRETYQNVVRDEIYQLRTNPNLLSSSRGLVGFMLRSIDDAGDTSQHWGQEECCFGFADGDMQDFKTGYNELKLWMQAAQGGDPSPNNDPPTAAFSVTCSGRACDFDGTASTDPETNLASWHWNFGDGSTATGATTSHTYASAGTYNVVLTVTDGGGLQDTETKQANPTNPPALSILGRYEAESFPLRPVGGPINNNASYSNNAGWNVWSNGSITTTINNPTAGDYLIGIKATGNAAFGVNPSMSLRVNGATAWTWSVVASEFYTYYRVVHLPAGTVSLAIAFTNDVNRDGQDRNLRVDYLQIQEDLFDATFSNVRGNTWWVETDVSVTGGTLKDVEARVNGGSWLDLDPTGWGSWAEEINAPQGSSVQFRAKSTYGAYSYSGIYTWPP